jgi:hypothetical protein
MALNVSSSVIIESSPKALKSKKEESSGEGSTMLMVDFGTPSYEFTINIGTDLISKLMILTPCDIPAQGLIGLIRILIPISCNFFSGNPSLKTPKLSVLGLERWVTDREVLLGCA